MKRIMPVIVTLFIIHLSPVFAQNDSTKKEGSGNVGKFDPKRDAAKDVQDAIVEATKTGKRILLDVGGEWCIWCHRLDTLFMQNKDLEEYRNAHYVVVKINYSKENENEEFLSKYPKIEGYPHLFVLEKDGKLLQSQDTGALESGKHHDHDKVLAFLEKWAAKKGE
jgi:thioredoxin-related protein